MDLAPSIATSGGVIVALPCVADVRLSLSTGGLFWVLGLARALPVWLVQTHWAIVEDSFYLEQEKLVRWLAGLPASVSAESCRGAVLETCESWRLAQRDWCLETHPNLYWSAERSLEAVLPKNGRRGLSELCDALAAGLDHRRGRPPETVDTLGDCARDTLALAAALDGPRPFVLTTLAPDESTPAVVRSLDEADIPCRRLSAGAWTDRFDAALAPALIDTGLAAALASGTLRLAGLQVVAPRAHVPSVAASAEGEGDRLAWNETQGGDDAGLWDGAVAVSWEVRCVT
jgi:hypothetical protein